GLGRQGIERNTHEVVDHLHARTAAHFAAIDDLVAHAQQRIAGARLVLRALLLSRGDFLTFVERPLSASLLGAAALLVIIVALPSIRKKRDETFVEEE
ncbi:hypothetical protein, partial [Bordetella bronchiseptica]|uniref:hypothetical protein n=1 Tax=Bordetella bronchiseptica TaxID=518 RepID=UPI000460EF47